MSVIEDTSKVSHDLMVPELKKISVHLDTFGKKMDEIARRAERRHTEVLAAIASLAEYNSIRDRLTRLELKHSPRQQPDSSPQR